MTKRKFPVMAEFWDIYAHLMVDAQAAVVLGVVAHVLCGGWG